ncbi:polysaccharide lyase 6 family protein [Chitinophaga sp.]|uniref:polysaccharide lyase 6 family protein n=1 Tax=Chitinophaga sp. TaxID=1869181 RepID=UPI0031DA92A2
MKTSLYLLAACLLATLSLQAANITVNSLPALQSAIHNARPGDVITLANGVYKGDSVIVINKQGTAGKPIVITSETVNGAEITGNGGFSLVAPAQHIVIKGFRFTHRANRAKSAPGTSFCRWTRNLFETPGDGENLSIAGSDHEVDYNTFQHKNAMGRFLAIRGAGGQIAERLHIHHNYFFDQRRQSGNGIETLQFGLSGFSMSSSNSVVEYNLFEDCAGENEMISVKASAVVLRYNTIRNCPAQFTLRHGNRCEVYGNYFVNTPGIRIFGDDHVIHSNYFEQCKPAINIGNGDGEVADGAKLTCHDRPDRVLIAFNTLVNNTENITQSGRNNGMGATGITLACNILQGSQAPAAQLAGPNKDISFSGNILHQVASGGDMPQEGYKKADPRLFKTAEGVYHLQPSSPAKGAVKTPYPAVKTDMDGQPRNLPLDAGADQVSTAPVTVRLLTRAMVGQEAAR